MRIKQGISFLVANKGRRVGHLTYRDLELWAVIWFSYDSFFSIRPRELFMTMAYQGGQFHAAGMS